MNLVDDFIDFGTWPMSRKTALMSAISAAVTFFGALLGGYLVERIDALDVSLLIPYLLVLILVYTVIAAISFTADAAGKDARWTAYLFVLVVSALLVGLMHLFGAMSTPLAAFLPCVLLLWLLFFDIPIAAAGFVSMLSFLVPVGYLSAEGVLPYAPMLVNRSIDAQLSPYWFGTFLLILLVLFGLCFTLGYLCLAAMRERQRRLGLAHQPPAGNAWFINFTLWPSSRKSLLIFGVSTTAMFISWLVARFVLSREGRVNLEVLEPFLLVWTLIFFVSTVAVLVPAWAGRDARWTAYLFVFVNCPLIASVMHLVGTMSNPLAALFPALLLQWLLYFDEWVCIAGFAWMMVLLVGVGILEQAGALRYAPILIDRYVDSQQSMSWYFSFLFVICTLSTLCFFAGLLVVWASRAQTERLQQARGQA